MQADCTDSLWIGLEIDARATPDYYVAGVQDSGAISITFWCRPVAELQGPQFQEYRVSFTLKKTIPAMPELGHRFRNDEPIEAINLFQAEL